MKVQQEMHFIIYKLVTHLEDKISSSGCRQWTSSPVTEESHDRPKGLVVELNEEITGAISLPYWSWQQFKTRLSWITCYTWITCVCVKVASGQGATLFLVITWTATGVAIRTTTVGVFSQAVGLFDGLHDISSIRVRPDNGVVSGKTFLFNCGVL